MNREQITKLEEWATINGVQTIDFTSGSFEWRVNFYPPKDPTQVRLEATPVKAKVITTGYVTARKHQLTHEEAQQAWSNSDAAATIHERYQKAHTEKWRAYYKDWKEQKSPEEQAKIEASRRVYQREYQRKRREEERLAREEFKRRKN